ncbi:MAG: DUF5406 family protein [Escherichia coli]|nr:DUF5406 family protein [Escherichia coli]
MENYDPNIQWGTHTIKVSFQQWDYKGFIVFEKVGNCKGLDILELGEDDLYDVKFKENPIEELLVEDEWYRLKDYIVGVEIVDFVEEEK